MKNNFFKCLIVAFGAILLIGCGDTPHPTSYMEIKGVITDESGQPLESISICIDSARAHLDHAMSYEEGVFSDQEGKYFMLCRGGYPAIFEEGWPSNMILIATDTTGIYETQEKTFSVDVQRSNWIKNFSKASVTADFVMKKK